MGNQLLPGTVWIQLDSAPVGASGPNEMVPLQIDRAIGVGRYLGTRWPTILPLSGATAWASSTHPSLSASTGSAVSHIELA